MWFVFALGSALLLGCYDIFKKHALRDNAVLPVLFLNTLFCSLIFIPFILLSEGAFIPSGLPAFVPHAFWQWHAMAIVKAVIVLSSWICGYFSIKHLPLSIVGPINATRPVLTLLGAVFIFGERFNVYQWTGIALALLAVFLLSRTGKREGIDFAHNRWILLLFLAALLGACSGLFDKYLLASKQQGGAGVDAMFLQSWFNIYQFILMAFILMRLWWPRRNPSQPFKWKWSIVGISVFLTLADLLYFYALSQDGALIAIVSMTRRSSVLVSFGFAAFVLREQNLKSKAVDLAFVLLSLLFLCIGALMS
ncbi:MAG: DMT family transporter [Bacteroidaceae bacterium]|nr:DMT family transporter [Bacteroidaceae bacterium]